MNQIQITNDMKELLVTWIQLLNKVESLEKHLQDYKQSDAVIIVLDSCQELGEKIVEYLDGKLNNIGTKYFRFGNNEINTFPSESVREKNVFIVGSGSNCSSGTINDSLMTMFAMIRACRDASAKYITTICPYFPYSRSDKKDQGRTPIMAKMTCDFFKEAGANRLITIDLHAAQIQGFFAGPFDNLYAINDLIEKIQSDYDNNFIIVSPDAGGVKRTENWSKKMGVTSTFLTKTRDHNMVSVINKHELVHQIDFTGKTAILVDDIGDTLGTLNSAAKILKEKGATKVIAVVTHGVFSGRAFENLAEDFIDRIYTTNTLPQQENLSKSSKIVVVDLSKLFAEAILSCVNATSMSNLFV
jgi:ribose-phosphate pyrophosphokinase